MTVLIPRTDIDAVMARHGDCWIRPDRTAVTDVREAAAEMRRHSGLTDSGDTRWADALLAEADDLDALADRYEKEAGR